MNRDYEKKYNSGGKRSGYEGENYKTPEDFEPNYGERGERDFSRRSPNEEMGYQGQDYGQGYQTGSYENRGYKNGGQRQINGGGGLGWKSTESYRGKGPKGYTRSDERVIEEINDRLTDHSWIDASEIEVECVSGEVTLKGSVDNREAKRLAEDIVEEVSGVKNVQNQLRVSKSKETESNGDLESNVSSYGSSSKKDNSSSRSSSTGYETKKNR